MAILALSEFEHIRLCPGNYIGGTETPTHLLYELIDNAADECITGNSKFLAVILNYDENKYTVIDKGRGIPLTSKHFKEEVPVIIATKLFTGGKFDNDLYQHRSGLHGEGLVIVNALSTAFEIITKNKEKHRQYIFNGQDVNIQDIEQKKYSTSVSFSPNPMYFDTVVIDQDTIEARMKSILVYNKEKDIEMYLFVIKDNKIQKIEISNTIIEEFESDCDKCINMKIENKKDELLLYIGCSNENKTKKFKGIVNTLNVDMGTHQKMIENILREYLYDKAMKNKMHVNKEDVFIGGRFLAIMKITNPAFAGQTKYALNMKESAIEHIINKNSIIKFLDANKEFIEYWLNIAQSYRIEVDSKKQTKTRKSRNIIIVDDLKDCISNNLEDRELFLLEGQSAGGTLQLARDINIHAILPLRGKVLNVLNVDKKKVFNSKAIMNIFTAMNVKPFSNDLSGLRYGKTIILCFTGDTKVKMLDGQSKSFFELVKMENQQPGREYWVYSMNSSGEIVPGKAYAPRITNYVNEIIHITIDNKFVVKCTPNHKFILHDGNEVEAKELKLGTKLMSLNLNMLHEFSIQEETNTNISNNMIYDSKVTKVEYKKFDTCIPVYNLTVENYHNYAILSEDEKQAILVKNCDADPDGKHIASLLLSMFTYCLPQIITEGRLYVVETPLFGCYDKKNFVPLYTEEEVEHAKSKNLTIFRYKGLGEMQPNELAACAIDKSKRKLIKVLSEQGTLTVKDVWMDKNTLINEYFSNT